MIIDHDNLPGYLPPLAYNLIADTDSYKLGHWRLYRKGTTTVYSYIESRGGRYERVMFAGLQRLLYKKLGQPITRDNIEEMAKFVPEHGLPFNREGWEIILNEYGGKLPVLIKAVPEGLVVPVKNALFSIENLDPRLPWLTSYLETLILRDLWTACTIATRIFEMTGRINTNWIKHSDNPMSPFALLDFSSRGVMGDDHSILGGIAHLFHFQGSDNVLAVREANYYYFHPMSAFSVMASEHSISCSFGRDNDDDYIANSIAATDPGAILSLVGDTWNIFEFVKKAVNNHQDEIINKGISFVARPDSGDLEDVLPRVIQILADGLGTDRNSKGREVIRYGAKVLQGDGMNERTHMLPFEIADSLGIAPDSIITAAGGGLMTADLDRDTNRWAMKASEMVINGERVDIYKDPITDPGKQSKRGRFALLRDEEGEFHTANRVNDAEDIADLLEPRYNGVEVINAHTLNQIRERVAAQL
ncbi:nicotinamide phosphoribosyl transferase [Caulobacter phage CcrPW]|uniref:Nicotinamide phosphoribosyltransferase n=1 Tax=Caulobacter phage CcrPW TaxID=2283271 RepID=A0A385EAP7_9CAUD|nr:nicotinamide phosphoribosyl transferase [Caulobacter phage CcrPW]AXQ68750.1 nicotinamide phosphoribosyltransferase [Caulobacter phage CcrPW]